MDNGASDGLESVWGSSSSDVFAVGVDGIILHYDGSAWSVMNSGTSDELYGVWGSSSTDVFAVGAYGYMGQLLYGTILHYKGGDGGH